MNGGSLCHRVIEPAQPGAHPVDARDRNDTSRSLRRHYRHGVFHRGKSAADMNGDRRVKPVEVDLGDADPLRARPGIVDEAIDPTEPSHGLFDHRLHVRLDSHIGWHEAGEFTQSPRKLFTPLAPTSGDYDSSSLFNNKDRRSACADAARSA